MSGPWEDFQQPQTQAQGEAGPWTDYHPASKPAAKPTYSGGFLPFSKDETGVHFDSNAGLLGTIKRALSLPGDVYGGKVDPLSDEAIGRSTDLAGIVSPVSPAARIGERMIPGPSRNLTDAREKVPVPTSDQLLKAGGSQIDQAGNMGVDYSSDAVKRMAEAFRAQAERKGFRESQAPQSFDVIDALTKPPADSVAGFQDLVSARRSAQNAAQNFNNPPDSRVASALIERLDKFLEGSDPSSVVAGPSAAASDLYKAGNANYAAGKRSDFLNGREDLAALRAKASNSGRNYDNSMRQRLIPLVDPERPSMGSGFSPSEKDAITRVIEGDMPRNAARTVANALGGGGGVIPTAMGGAAGAAVGSTFGSPVLGAALGGTVGAAPGLLAKTVQNLLAKKAFNNIDEMVRMRSPLYEEALAASPRIAKDPAKQSALIRALLAQDPQGNRR